MFLNRRCSVPTLGGGMDKGGGVHGAQTTALRRRFSRGPGGEMVAHTSSRNCQDLRSTPWHHRPNTRPELQTNVGHLRGSSMGRMDSDPRQAVAWIGNGVGTGHKGLPKAVREGEAVWQLDTNYALLPNRVSARSRTDNSTKQKVNTASLNASSSWWP